MACNSLHTQDTLLPLHQVLGQQAWANALSPSSLLELTQQQWGVSGFLWHFEFSSDLPASTLYPTSFPSLPGWRSHQEAGPWTGWELSVAEDIGVPRQV